MNGEEEEIYLCVKKGELHTPEAGLLSCFKCGTDVWVSPWNIGKKLICIDCLKILIKEGKCHPQAFVKFQDFLRAKQVLDGNNS